MMDDTKNGGPAFPRAAHEGETTKSGLQNGMSLRDYFAAKAMAGMIGGDPEWAQAMNYEQLALRSYDIADAMLSARGAS